MSEEEECEGEGVFLAMKLVRSFVQSYRRQGSKTESITPRASGLLGEGVRVDCAVSSIGLNGEQLSGA